ncbi:MAG: cytochrome c3 family protein [Pseudomonadota bacterium]
MKFINALKWKLWIFLVLGLSGYLGAQLFIQEEKADFLIGQTSHGHFQIEMACESCHGNGFGGPEVIQEACLSCHAEELKISQDSHPKTKFTDPRNVDRLEKIDARMCVSCHVEHNPDIMHPMGVSLPTDFCFHCHQDIAEDRVSHEGMGFETCASSGCHNYHDNRALYEDFLLQHAGNAWVDESGKQLAVELSAYLKDTVSLPTEMPPLSFPQTQKNQDTLGLWADSAHAQNNIGCDTCHDDRDNWNDSPNMQVCETCHSTQTTQFQQGKHGMRLAQGLTAMTPAMSMDAHSRLKFKASHADTELSCNSCHNPHSVDRVYAAVDACLSCHQDEHSTHYLDSPHGLKWEQVRAGEADFLEGVSCASCHMPRMEVEVMGQKVISVQHNQNTTLRPNEKMIRPVCLNCHSLEFSIDALADPALIKTNFSGQPANTIPSVQMALDRLQ